MPLWWDGQTFVSGVKGGENILLNKTNVATDEQTGGNAEEENRNGDISTEDIAEAQNFD